MVEPMVACQNCRTTYSIEDGIPTMMRCPSCGRSLVPTEGEWFTKDIEANSSGNHEKVYSVVIEAVAVLQLPAHNEVDAEAIVQFITSLPVLIMLEI